MLNQRRGSTIPYLKIKVSRDPELTTVELRGELDSVGADRLRTILADQIRLSRLLIVDLTALDFMDGGGLRAMIEADTLAREAGVLLQIRTGPPTVDKVFRLTGFDTRLNFLAAAPATVLPTAALP